MASRDPLELSGLDPDVINANIATNNARPENASLLREKRLAAEGKANKAKASTSSALPPPPPDPPPPPPVDIPALLDKIAAYRERFPHLKSRNGKLSAKSAPEEVKDELHYIESQLGSNNANSSIAAQMLVSAMSAVELCTETYYNPLGLRLSGLTAVTKQNMHEFQPLLDELMIKHSWGVATSPEFRLVMVIGATILTVNSANQNPETANAVRAMAARMQAPPGTSDL